MQRRSRAALAGFLRLALLAAGLGVVPACGPHMDVRAERSTIATFGRYATYAWALPAAPARSARETNAALVDWRIRNAVDRGLAAKGYVRTADAASLFVDYDVAAREQNTEAFQDYFRHRRQGGTKDMGEPFVAGYPPGTLVLQLVDARTRQLAYRASATGAVDEGGDRRRLDEAIERMLADLPRVMTAAGR